MNAFYVIAEGVAATLLMTAFVYCSKYITHREVGVVRILGSMITGMKGDNGQPLRLPVVICTGGIVHYFVGILFSLVFNSLWDAGWVKPKLVYCLDLGFAAGVIAVIVWRVFFEFHPRPPQIQLRLYLTIIFLGHLVFGIGMYLTRNLITG